MYKIIALGNRKLKMLSREKSLMLLPLNIVGT